MPRILLLGDSLFQRAFSQEKDSTGQIIGSFGPRLTDAYVRRLEVVNRGFSGYNTRQILSDIALNRWACYKPIITIIFLGANDARLPDTPGGPQQHIPLAEFEKNLGAIVERAKRDAKHVILITPPPVDERQTVATDSKNDPELEGVIRRKAETTRQYASMAAKVGERKKVAVLDLWSLIVEKASTGPDETKTGNDLKNDDYLDECRRAISEPRNGSAESALLGSSEAPVSETLQSYLHDGLHFTRKGYDFLFDELMTLIAEKFPEQLPERIPFAEPSWDDEKAWKNLKSPFQELSAE